MEFDTSELVRGDTAAQSAALTAGVNGGWLNPNECRHELNMNPGPDCLNAYRVAVNYQNADTLLDTQNVQDEPIDNKTALIPTDAQRSVLAGYTTAFLRVARDAVGRLAARPADKRDLQTVQNIFDPLVASVAELSADSAKRSTDAPEWQYEPTRVTSDYLTKLVTRAATWKPENLDVIASQELQRITKALAIDAHRSIGEFIALKGLSHVA